MTTDDFSTFDLCPTYHAFNTLYTPLRVSFHFALNEAIHSALLANDPIRASEKILSLAANPGIDYQSKNVYPSVIHHSHLAELLSTYLLTIESTPSIPVQTKWGAYLPKSHLLPDGRLRRIVLCDRWTPEREQIERFSWRTVADTVITNRPMLITALVIGGLKEGFRPSPWTQGFIHPTNGEMRVQKREGKFTENWSKLYREQRGIKPLEWLKIMQNDGVFEERVFSITEDVPANRLNVMEQLEKMAHEMTSPTPRQTRSACYRFTPCPFLPACTSNRSPSTLGWTEKPAAPPLPVLLSG